MNKYIKVRVGKKGTKTATIDKHRLVWMKANGDIPDGYDIHHKNGDKSDNRLENLQLVTRSEHCKIHGIRPPIWSVTYLKKGHKPPNYSEERAKLVPTIRKLIRQGVGVMKISRQLNVSRYFVSDVKRGRTYINI